MPVNTDIQAHGKEYIQQDTSVNDKLIFSIH